MIYLTWTRQHAEVQTEHQNRNKGDLSNINTTSKRHSRERGNWCDYVCFYNCGVCNNHIVFFNLRDRNILCIFLLPRVCILHFVCCSVFILSNCFFFSMLLIGHIGWKLYKFSFITIYMGNIAVNLFIQVKYLKIFHLHKKLLQAQNSTKMDWINTVTRIQWMDRSSASCHCPSISLVLVICFLFYFKTSVIPISC